MVCGVCQLLGIEVNGSTISDFFSRIVFFKFGSCHGSVTFPNETVSEFLTIYFVFFIAGCAVALVQLLFARVFSVEHYVIKKLGGLGEIIWTTLIIVWLPAVMVAINLVSRILQCYDFSYFAQVSYTLIAVFIILPLHMIGAIFLAEKLDATAK
ncbi:hypothetical protein SAMN05443551_0176 [Marivita hallyeonensis]|uniref:Uncharacterized protein n=1 Tax=Marivita hallyeonensis TaxID=996342 RepID=A0A1M5YA07_9RHOB|nr:hypothetical protein SAMN05443551_0176 [Marivita hallyeonensis]